MGGETVLPNHGVHIMRWKDTWGLLPLESTSSLDIETARASLSLRATQSIHAKYAVWVVCAATVFSLYTELPLGNLLAWALPIMLMAEVNWRVSQRTVTALNTLSVRGIRRRQTWMWWSSFASQSLMGSTVWWLGSTQDFSLTVVGTALMLVYLGAAMVNAATHPITFVPGAWINLLSACAFWLSQGSNYMPLVLALLGAGLMLTRLSLYMADSFRESLRMRFENEALLRQLEKEKQLVEEAMQFKTDFLANISHEVRTPVSAIMGMSYLALKSDLTARQRDYIQVIQQCSQHLHGLINQVLDFSKIEANMLKLERTEFSLKAVLDSVQAINADKASAKGLGLVVRVSQGTPARLVGDSLRLTEILVNFLNNAIKFTEAGQIHLDIESKDQRPHQVQLHFSVSDTGVGISPEEIGRLFKSFSQADSSTTRKHGGTGLGLAISKRLAELMGGDVGVSSEPGNGSTFWFSAWFDLPRTAEEGADATGELATAVPHEMAWAHSTPVTTGSHSGVEHPVETGPNDESHMVGVCWQLSTLTHTDNPAAVNLLDLNAEALQDRLGPAFQPLAQLVRGHELPKAANLLAGLGYRTSQGVNTAHGVTEGATPKPSVLVVDDTAVNLTVMTDLLKDDHAVRVATSGQRALEIAQSQSPPDLILLDIMMPVMDGYEVLSRLKSHDATVDIPVMFLTAKSQLEDEERGLNLGAADFINKPFSPPLVRRRIRTQLELKAVKNTIAPSARQAD